MARGRPSLSHRVTVQIRLCGPRLGSATDATLQGTGTGRLKAPRLGHVPDAVRSLAWLCGTNTPFSSFSALSLSVYKQRGFGFC